MSRFVTHYNFVDVPKKEYLVDSTEKVETAGYVSKEKMICSMINAGMRLQEVRKNEFDGSTFEEALENADPTRVNDFDIVDAGLLLSQLQDSVGTDKARTELGDSLQVKSDSCATTADSTTEGRE